MFKTPSHPSLITAFLFCLQNILQKKKKLLQLAWRKARWVIQAADLNSFEAHNLFLFLTELFLRHVYRGFILISLVYLGEESHCKYLWGQMSHDCFWHDQTTSAGEISAPVFKSLYCLSPGQVTELRGTFEYRGC